jgi:hypothetical protein
MSELGVHLANTIYDPHSQQCILLHSSTLSTFY